MIEYLFPPDHGATTMTKTYAGLDLSLMPAGAKIPNPRTIEGRQIRDLRDLRDFVDACIDAQGNVALNVPYDMRLIRTDNRYDLEITRW